MAIATADDLQKYMSGVKMTTPQYQSASQIITGVQEDLELYLNRPLELTAMREAVVADETGYVKLSISPVLEIRRIVSVSSTGDFNSISVGPLPVDNPLPPFEGPSFDVVPKNLGRDLICPGGAVLGGYSAQYIVDYLGGGGDFMGRYKNSLIQAVLRVAAREWQIMHNDSMRVVNGGPSEPVDPVPPTHKGWMQEELEAFDRLRRRTIV